MFQKYNYLLVFETDIYECFKNKESNRLIEYICLHITNKK